MPDRSIGRNARHSSCQDAWRILVQSASSDKRFIRLTLYSFSDSIHERDRHGKSDFVGHAFLEQPDYGAVVIASMQEAVGEGRKRGATTECYQRAAPHPGANALLGKEADSD